jgi:hypothetical protein
MTFRLAQLARLTTSVANIGVVVAIINVVVVAVVIITDPLAVGTA